MIGSLSNFSHLRLFTSLPYPFGADTDSLLIAILPSMILISRVRWDENGVACAPKRLS